MRLKKIIWIQMAIISTWIPPSRAFWILIWTKTLNIIEKRRVNITEKTVFCQRGNPHWRPNWMRIRETRRSSFCNSIILARYHQEWPLRTPRITRSINLASVRQIWQSKLWQNFQRRLKREACTTAKRSCNEELHRFLYMVTQSTPSFRTVDFGKIAIWAK